MTYCVFERHATRPGNLCCRACGFTTQGEPDARHVRKCPAGELPGLARQATSYVRSTGLWARNGRRLATSAQQHERLGICGRCPDSLRVRGALRCRLCGCHLAEKARRNTRPGESDCPAGRWPALAKDTG